MALALTVLAPMLLFVTLLFSCAALVATPMALVLVSEIVLSYAERG